MATITRKPRQVKPAHGVASLTLRINGTPYRVRPVACDPESGVTKCYALRKADGTTYHVAQFASWCECDCPSWIFDHDGLADPDCKHIAACKALGLIG